MVKVLFVCLGNICRSPTAEGIFQDIVDSDNTSKHFDIQSAGTSSYHVGSPPDIRSQECSLKNGIDISQQKSRQFSIQDYYEYDYILAMDENNYRDIMEDYPTNATAQVELILDYLPGQSIKSVPDPYWGNDGFENVFSLLSQSCKQLYSSIKMKHLSES